MNSKDMEFNSADELLELIRKINEKYYDSFTANILYLEESADTIYITYLVGMRDAYSHLVEVFDYDIHTPNGKKNAEKHLNAYTAHLQNGLLDTFRKILDLELKSLLKYIRQKDVQAIEHQIAQKAHTLRLMNKDNSVDNRIAGYKSLLKYIMEIRERFPPGKIKPQKS